MVCLFAFVVHRAWLGPIACPCAMSLDLPGKISADCLHAIEHVRADRPTNVLQPMRDNKTPHGLQHEPERELRHLSTTPSAV